MCRISNINGQTRLKELWLQANLMTHMGRRRFSRSDPRLIDILVSKHIFRQLVDVERIGRLKRYKIKDKLELLPNYSTDLRQAMKIVEDFGYWRIYTGKKKHFITCTTDDQYALWTDDIAAGICRVALMAVCIPLYRQKR